MKLIVIDPRCTEVARRAFLHLQIRPGTDVEVLACLLHVIIDEHLQDAEFLRAHANGVDELRAAVAAFTPMRVAARAGVPANDLAIAARTFASSRHGYAQAGTGPNMHGRGTLAEYLVLCLDTVCGHWSRPGDVLANPGVLVASVSAIAQARSPWPATGFGERLRVRGLTDSVAGMPTSALPEEILLPGDQKVRALISLNGNPVVAFPDQILTVEAMRSLELLVQVDAWMSQTAKLAHYVIAARMPLEMAGTSYIQDAHLRIGNGYGSLVPFGQYTSAVVDPPDGSDLIEEWELYYGLAQRLGLPLSIGVVAPAPIDMADKPSTDALLETFHLGSRVSLDEVKQHASGGVFAHDSSVIFPPDAGWTGRFDVANAAMTSALEAIAEDLIALGGAGTDFQGLPMMRLVCRRMTHVMNSACNIDATNRGRRFNPAFLHPEDLDDLGLVPGDQVEIRSERAVIAAIVEADDSIRRGVVSMTHAFGDVPALGLEEDSTMGSNTGRLVGIDDSYDRFSGQPRMSDIGVVIRRRHAEDDFA